MQCSRPADQTDNNAGSCDRPQSELSCKDNASSQRDLLLDPIGYEGIDDDGDDDNDHNDDDDDD